MEHFKEITTDSVMQIVAKGKPFTLVLLKGTDKQPIDQNGMQQLQMSHLVHLFQMEKEGKISIFGPVTNDETFKGIIVFNTTDETTVKKEMDVDPFIVAGYMKYELFGWFSIPGQTIP